MFVTYRMNGFLCRYELEIHMVHNNSLGHLAVIGVVYELGRPDPFLAKVSGYWPVFISCHWHCQALQDQCTSAVADDVLTSRSF